MKRISIREMKYYNMIRMNYTLNELLRREKEISGFIFTFENLRWIDPSGAVIFLETIDNLKEHNIYIEFEPIDETRSAVSYGVNIGIFQRLGLSESTSKEKGETYLAPTKITLDDVSNLLSDVNQNIEYYFEFISDEISKKILRYNKLLYDKRIKKLFIYVIRELIRNIFDHSKTNYYYYGSQFIPSTNTVELVIADRGVGLKNTIPFDSEEKWFGQDTAENAIKKAFMPGVTAASNHGYASDDYLNSGFGLAMVRSLISKADGILSVATSEKSITFANKKYRMMDCNIQGTVIRLRVDLKRLSMVDFNKQLDLVSKEAQSLDNSFKPSKRSLTL